MVGWEEEGYREMVARVYGRVFGWREGNIFMDQRYGFVGLIFLITKYYLQITPSIPKFLFVFG